MLKMFDVSPIERAEPLESETARKALIDSRFRLSDSPVYLEKRKLQSTPAQRYNA